MKIINKTDKRKYKFSNLKIMDFFYNNGLCQKESDKTFVRYPENYQIGITEDIKVNFVKIDKIEFEVIE